MQQTLSIMQDPKTQIKEVWRVQTSENVDNHDMLCELDEIAVSSTKAAIDNTNPLAYFEEFRSL